MTMIMTDKEKIEKIKEALNSWSNNELSDYAAIWAISSIVVDPLSEEEMKEWAKTILEIENEIENDINKYNK